MRLFQTADTFILNKFSHAKPCLSLSESGRPRRCGWLDIPVVQYSHMLNNYNSLNITKLDVLSDLDEIKIGA